MATSNDTFCRARISAGWSHDRAHYRFLRTSPPEHARLPFAHQWSDRRAAERRAIVGSVVGAAMFAGLLALLAFAPDLARWIP